MSMTVTEKEHFQRRLSDRAAELNTEIVNADAKWQRELVKQAVELVEEHYGLEQSLAELRAWHVRREEAETHIVQIKEGIVAHVRGLKPEHVYAENSNNSYDRYSRGMRYNSTDPVPVPDPFTEDDFKNYPSNARKVLHGHADAEFQRLLKMHPVGQRLTKLREQYLDFKDRLVGCANHAQLAQVWQDVATAFNLIMEETKDRQLRKIDTTRSTAAQPATTAKAKKAKK